MSEPAEERRTVREIIESYGPHTPGAAAPLVEAMLRARGHVLRELTPDEKRELDDRMDAAMAEAERFWAERGQDAA